MRKFILMMVLTGFSAGIFAQSLEDIEKYLALQRWEEAKGLVDKYLSQEKNSKNAKGWYYKGYIYSELAKSEKYKGTNTRMESFEAFKKYQELDPKNAMMKDNQNQEFFILYNAYFDDAINNYNAKKYDEALQDFKNAGIVEQYVQSKGYSYNNFSFSALDTQLIQNTALAAYLAKKNDEAAFYYQKLADAKVKGEGFFEIYQFLVEHFGEKGDLANKNKYLALGKELYPESDYWCDIELKEAGDDQKKRFAKYDEMLNGTCGTFAITYNYAAELFNYLYTGDQKPADYTAMQNKLESVIKKVFALKNGAEANLLMARHLYNMVFDVQDSITAIKGGKPEDVKKRNTLVAALNKKYDELLPYATAVEEMYAGKTGLKNREKGDLKVAYNLILSYWENKKDQGKIKEYTDKMKALD
jgi:hypothetical protein